MPDKNEAQQILETGFSLPGEKHVYFNGFACAISPFDIVILLQENGKPTMVLNCSHVAAKGLVGAVGALLADFERKTEREILTIEQAQKVLSGEST